MTDPATAHRHTLIRAVVGSTAYGLTRENSDIDRLEVFAWPTDAFWHLGALPDGFGQQSPENPDDFRRHEVSKFVHLALKCNPSILELLWSRPEHLEEVSGLGLYLISIRQAFLSEASVRGAFGEYASKQVERLVRRNAEGKEGFSSDTKKRTAKHARHCFRLLNQGRDLLATGDLQLRVPNPEDYWRFDEMSVEGIVDSFDQAYAAFAATESTLPESPDYLRVDRFLYGVRRTLLA